MMLNRPISPTFAKFYRMFYHNIGLNVQSFYPQDFFSDINVTVFDPSKPIPSIYDHGDEWMNYALTDVKMLVKWGEFSTENGKPDEDHSHEVFIDNTTKRLNLSSFPSEVGFPELMPLPTYLWLDVYPNQTYDSLALNWSYS